MGDAARNVKEGTAIEKLSGLGRGDGGLPSASPLSSEMMMAGGDGQAGAMAEAEAVVVAGAVAVAVAVEVSAELEAQVTPGGGDPRGASSLSSGDVCVVSMITIGIGKLQLYFRFSVGDGVRLLLSCASSDALLVLDCSFPDIEKDVDASESRSETRWSMWMWMGLRATLIGVGSGEGDGVGTSVMGDRQR